RPFRRRHGRDRGDGGLSARDAECGVASTCLRLCDRALDKTRSRHERERFHCERAKLMDKFTRLEGVAAPLRMINVDTDMIIPKQYLKTIKRTGLGKGLFAEKRDGDAAGDD